MTRLSLLACAAAAPLLMAAPAFADDATPVSEVIVTGDIAFRDRTNDVNPVLAYDLDYFQRFEPVSVGEMLKRVPGVTFTSDVLEFDGVSMRGLPPGYTQVLINGRRAPGGEADRSFFVDRIPAELVERIEIIRSPRADQPSDGMAGSLNVVLKEGANLEGGFVKLGALINEDGKARPSAAIAYAGATASGDTTYWAGLNYQGRRNPKKKVSHRYDEDFGDFDNVEYQSDTRDGVDISANGELAHRFENGKIRFSGLVVDTDRDEDETSLTYNELPRGDFDGVEVQAERIKQRTYALDFDGEFDAGPGKIGFDLGWSRYDESTNTTVGVGDEENLSDLGLDEYVELDIDDEEWGAGAYYKWKSDALELKAGVDLLKKTRDGAEVEFDVDDGVVGDPDPEPGAIYKIEETRVDPYVRLTFEPSTMWTFDAGLRYETTKRDVESDLGKVSKEAEELNPSLHATFRPTDVDQFRASIARTVRRPNYDLLAPFVAEEEPADEDDLRGNPNLDNETAWGLDVGYERKLGARGIIGINFFYRDIENLIDTIATDEVSSSGLGRVYEPRNIGSGKTYGVEVDFSTPLDVIGLPNTGVFFNYTWLESEVKDPFTGQDRPFTNQPSYVYNVGFVHTVPTWNASFGASLYDRDMGHESGLDEEVTVDYDPDLEAFVEKRFGDRYVVRLAAMNLLDKEKRETYRTFDGDSVDEILANRLARNVHDSERESERSGVLYQVTFRAAF
ncbi:MULTISPECIES: TonB-dependent receptor plug domain-containing protein [Phenylobacterium]|uniref:Outer membrane receptor protein involved in Fe transport n=1 Tax=Phenylobacterium koreense TaxID=266125 RepID=A0ABV2EHB3_9CAUL